MWGQEASPSKFHWLGRDSLLRPIEEGGIGILKLSSIATAFHLKLLWMIHTKKSIWAKYMQQRYLRDSFSCSPLPYRCSALLKRLHQLRNLFHSSTRWFFGKGEISFWEDNWSGAGSIRSLISDSCWGIMGGDLHQEAEDSRSFKYRRRLEPATLHATGTNYS